MGIHEAKRKQKLAEDYGYSGHVEMVIGMYEDGMSYNDIADVVGVTETSIGFILKKHGIKGRSRGGTNNWIIPQWGREMIESEKRLTYKIARKKYSWMFLCGCRTIMAVWYAGRKRRINNS